MINIKYFQESRWHLIKILAILLLVAGCSSPNSITLPNNPSSTAAMTIVAMQAPIEAEVPPYPYTTPLPPSIPTPIDGIYVKLDPNPDTPTPCRRCADYRPEGGIWAISFNKGVFSMLHRNSGWRSAASYTVTGNNLSLFNDPNCIEELGLYRWKLEKGYLILQVVSDECSFQLRGKNLTAIPWAMCQPRPRTRLCRSDRLGPDAAER